MTDARAAPAAPFDVAACLDNGAWGGFQKVVLLLAALAFAVDGFANQVLGLAIPAMVLDWHLTRDAFAPVFALGLAGLAIGTVIGGMWGDRYGRRPVLIGSVLFFGAATVAIGFIGNMRALILLRIVAGLGLGAAVPCATSLIAEYTPARSRSLAISIGMVFIPLGGILSGSAATWLLGGGDWRGLFAAAGWSSIAVAALLAATLPESPRFLLRQPARHGQLRRLMGRFGHAIDPEAALAEDASGRRLSMPITELFTSAVRGDTLALWAAFFCCLLSTYSMQSWAPTAMASAGVAMARIGAILAGFGFGGVAGSLFAGVAIGRFGSRATIAGFAFGSAAIAVALALLPPSQIGVGPTILGCALLGIALSGVQSPLYALAANIYAPACRASGVGMASALGRLGAMASSFTGVMSIDMGGTRGFFLFLALMMLLSWAATLPIRRHIAF